MLLTDRSSRNEGSGQRGRTDGPPHRPTGPGPVPRGRLCRHLHRRSGRCPGRLQGRHLLPLPIQGCPAAPPDRSPPGRHRRLHPRPQHRLTPHAATAAGRLPQRPARLPGGRSAGRQRRRRPQSPQDRPTAARPEPPAPVPADRLRHQRIGQVAGRGGPGGDLASPDRRAPARPHRPHPPGHAGRRAPPRPERPAHQHMLVDAAVATLQPRRTSSDGEPVPAAQSTPTPSTHSS
jgi:hypothetical protein